MFCHHYQINMNTRRQEKIAQEMMHVAADFLAREMGKQSLVTVTRVEVPDDLRHVTVFISVLPTSQEGPALEAAKRARRDFREYVSKHSGLSPLPTFDFVIDVGEKNRQRVDELTGK